MGKPEYTVLSQRQSEEMTSDSRFVDVINVTVESPLGHVFTLKVPLREYEPETVRELIRERIAVLDAVHTSGL